MFAITSIYLTFQAVNLDESVDAIDNDYELSHLSPVQQTNEIRIEYDIINLSVDCFHRIVNVWAKVASKSMCKPARVDLAEDSKEIDYHLRIKFYICSITRTMHKLFNPEFDYPKGDRDFFKSFMEEHHPNKLLQHVESTNGNMQPLFLIHLST